MLNQASGRLIASTHTSRARRLNCSLGRLGFEVAAVVATSRVLGAAIDSDTPQSADQSLPASLPASPLPTAACQSTIQLRMLMVPAGPVRNGTKVSVLAALPPL